MLSQLFVSNMDLAATGNTYMFNFIFLILFGLIDGIIFLIIIWFIIKLFYKFFKIFSIFFFIILIMWLLMIILVGTSVNSKTIDLTDINMEEVEKQLNKNNNDIESVRLNEQESTNNYGGE